MDSLGTNQPFATDPLLLSEMMRGLGLRERTGLTTALNRSLKQKQPQINVYLYQKLTNHHGGLILKITKGQPGGGKVFTSNVL